MENEINIDLSTLQIDQLGYVYKDIESQARKIEKRFGIKEFVFTEPNTHHYIVRGKEQEIVTRLSFSRIFNIQIELIQWISGECAFKEFLDQGKEGLQHVSLFVDDIEAYSQAMIKQGFELAMEGNIGRLRKIFYFDTVDALGMMLEVQGPVKKKRKK